MMNPSGKLRLAAFLMIMTIVLIGCFQGYWIWKLYTQEWIGLKKEADVVFREIVYDQQMQRFSRDKVVFSSGHMTRKTASDDLFVLNVLDSLKLALKDTLKTLPKGIASRRMNFILQADIRHDSLPPELAAALPPGRDEEIPRIIRLLSSDSATPPLTMGQLDSAYKKMLVKAGITVPYRLRRIEGKEASQPKPVPNDELSTGFIFIGLANAYGFQAQFSSPFGYILGKLRLPIAISVLLLAFTTLSLIFLYRNLVRQRQVAVIKNEFISNMTHELRTPIATVTVAVEALQHFGALEDPVKTKEYLDISALELQRLSLLVDKVLKLSLFENRQIELKPERIDLPALTAEVLASMKLSLEKAGAVVQLNGTGEGLFVRADRMHLGSVISNLLDNALKYRRESPVLSISLLREGDVISLSVADNGIGIPLAYREKIFEKFFRVPSGDVHNTKGYGLGLSYVHHIVTRHEGKVSVESKEGKGSTFTIQLPAA